MKSILQSIIMLVVVLTLPLCVHASDGVTKLGDVNCDDDVNIGDMTYVIDLLLGEAAGNFSASNPSNRDHVTGLRLAM